MREIFLNPAQMYQIKPGNLLKRKKTERDKNPQDYK